MYASEEKFGGQRASVGRTIVLRDGLDEDVEAGVVTKIRSDGMINITSSYSGVDYNEFQFVETKTEADVDALPPRSWTWPVRV